jgi:hypothetical protein
LLFLSHTERRTLAPESLPVATNSPLGAWSTESLHAQGLAHVNSSLSEFTARFSPT